ncbi:hypothetical protein [Nocardia sp. bgisy118]|uniref:hypothetical protein n=1 Tax=Nocardia sp. bgisy118 TaxID=3413786 RepID=UPI003F4A2F1C
MDDFLAVSGMAGTAVGIAGILFAIIASRRTARARRRRQDLLQWAIDRANHAKMEHEILDDLVATNNDPLLARWLWLSHQSGTDMYLALVDEYLSGEKKFTYADLNKIADTGLVGGAWQYRYWLSKIVLRPENRGEDAPAAPQFTSTRVRRHNELRRLEAEGGNAALTALNADHASASEKAGDP